MIYHRFLPVLLLILCTDLYAFDHQYQQYGNVLRKYVKNSRVDYASLQQDRTGIDGFVKDLAAVTGAEYGSWSRDQQLAFWINAYNGWFLQIVIDRYPLRGKRLFGALYPENSVQRIPGIWDNIKITAAGRSVSLNDIEHKIIRRLFQEPRIHFAIVCASVGCPVLASEPYLPETLSSQLDEAAKKFLNDPAKARWNEREKKLEVSPIFEWFPEDFEAAGGPVAFVTRYGPDSLVSLVKTRKFKVDYLEYDWSLNDIPR